jgi:hypothetical protein
MDATNNYAYFAEELLFSQFSQLAENIQKALPPDSQGQNEISQQILRINSKKEKWPSRILSLYRNRSLPVFSMEAVTKLNQAHDAFINDPSTSLRSSSTSAYIAELDVLQYSSIQLIERHPWPSRTSTPK